MEYSILYTYLPTQGSALNISIFILEATRSVLISATLQIGRRKDKLINHNKSSQIPCQIGPLDLLYSVGEGSTAGPPSTIFHENKMWQENHYVIRLC